MSIKLAINSQPCISEALAINTAELSVNAGQYSIAGIKQTNEDCIGLQIPQAALLGAKGVAVVIADGVSSHAGGKIAAECAVQGFLADYYSTPDSWSVKYSAHKVLTAINHWLYAEGRRRYSEEHGMLTTFSALVLKSSSAYLFHIGDTRIYRLRGGRLDLLTRDHRIKLAKDRSFLSRALGADLHIEIDYQQLSVDVGDLFLLMSDGVYESIADADIKAAALDKGGDPEKLCTELVDLSLKRGSLDNLSCQAVCVTTIPSLDQDDFYRRVAELPFPPPLSEGQRMDGYRVLRELHASARSQVYLAVDESNGQLVALKTPSPNYVDDPSYIEAFLQEEWIGRRVNHANVVKVQEPRAGRSFLYYATEYLDGDTLKQWMADHPAPGLGEVRAIVEQIASGLRAFHRLQTIHRDLKPDNIVIDRYGQVKLIDFGCARIAAFAEINQPGRTEAPPGTREYGAPELLDGHAGDVHSDQYSLAVIAYQMLTGALPFDRSQLRSRQAKLEYRPATQVRRDLPAWIDKTLKRALNSDPARRYESLSEFIYDLSHPNPAYLNEQSAPLLERDPLMFWKALALGFAALSAYLAYRLTQA